MATSPTVTGEVCSPGLTGAFGASYRLSLRCPARRPGPGLSLTWGCLGRSSWGQLAGSQAPEPQHGGASMLLTVSPVSGLELAFSGEAQGTQGWKKPTLRGSQSMAGDRGKLPAFRSPCQGSPVRDRDCDGCLPLGTRDGSLWELCSTATHGGNVQQ